MDKQSFKVLTGKTKRAALVFRALNHHLRQQILSYLIANPQTDVTSLYKKFHIEQSVASQHLAILRREGLVSAQREGKRMLYSVNNKRLEDVEKIADRLLAASSSSFR
ncbi:ArsR/SmtB family transcription factor [Flavisolibacter ginsenosidimutans]|uniref:Helix-turn-helix transcriptional regulator n=1 Tax=Flavisolibacter ginsenosidimutans TaxID=661481 RepID=A0A5B8UKL5_9BACT|nr:metalloregulator ArsR/SmtB family transcription factor [Flavisolibacter ginsenosidimutans]QEC56719.1 helix-turn-helix transcriptional regulator [Flavisolibacter ginsenosidimutans]